MSRLFYKFVCRTNNQLQLGCTATTCNRTCQPQLSRHLRATPTALSLCKSCTAPKFTAHDAAQFVQQCKWHIFLQRCKHVLVLVQADMPWLTPWPKATILP